MKGGHMKILFVTDNVFLTKNSNVYSNELPYMILKRYVEVFSKVTVLARVSEAEEVNNLPLASGEGLEFIFLESISTFSSFFGLRSHYKEYIGDLLSKHDGVIARVPSELGLMTMSLARDKDTKCLVEVVGSVWDVMWNYGGLKAKIYAPFYFLRTKNSIRKMEYVSYVTEHFLQEKYPAANNAKTIALSDVELPALQTNVLESRVEKIEKMGEKIIFGTIGSLNVHYKGIDVAFKTLAKMFGRYPHFEYHILGGGDPTAYKMLAEKLGISDKVFFDGTLPRGRAVFDWLDHVDIYLQPSLAEGLPRSLIEAMSRGCPALGSSVGGIPELLQNSMIFDRNDPQRMFQTITTLLSNKELMISCAKYNFSIAKKYEKNLLDEKRKSFMIDFRNSLA